MPFAPTLDTFCVSPDYNQCHLLIHLIRDMASLLSKRHPFFQYRFALLICIIIIVPVGYIVRFAKEPGPLWLHDFLGAIAYEIFWILLYAFFFPKASSRWTAIGVCLATCALEFLQLWQPPFLQAIRATLPGRLVLGNSFTWSDFISYFVGSFAGWLWMDLLRNKFVVLRKS
jgi:glycopeptide antibiotics resistance protein